MNYPIVLDILLEKVKKNSKTEDYLLIIKNYCIELNNENDLLRHQLEILQNNDESRDDESFDEDEVYTYEQIQEIKADNDVKTEEIKELYDRTNELEYEIEDLNDRINEIEYELKVRDERLNELEEIDDRVTKLEEFSTNSIPINVNVHIDSANIISDKNMDKNDYFNKDMVFDTFTIEIKRDKAWIQVNNQPKFSVGSKKEKGKVINYKALFNELNKRYVIRCNEVTHQLIVNDKTFQELVADTSTKRMFTFIEYNENYDAEHAKNFNYNCDQVAAVLLPYIWKQLPTEDRIKMNNFVKIITVFKFDDNKIKADEFRFIIVYKNNNGDLSYYEVNKDIKFKTNIIFNFIEQNMSCDTLKKFNNMTILNNNRSKIQQHVKNNLNQAWNNKVISSNIELENDDNGKYLIEYKFDFNFNQTITSENLPQLFLALKNYCRFEIVNKTTLVRTTSEIKVLKSKKYGDKILNHYVSEFTKEEFDKINLSSFDGLIEPDTVVVSY